MIWCLIIVYFPIVHSLFNLDDFACYMTKICVCRLCDELHHRHRAISVSFNDHFVISATVRVRLVCKTRLLSVPAE